MTFIIIIIKLSLIAIESINAVHITFRRGCSVFKVGLDVDGADDLPRF